MRSTKWRIALPAVQVVLAVMMLTASQTRSQPLHARDEAASSGAASQAMIIFNPEGWDQSDPALEISVAINFPALVIALPVVVISRAQPPVSYIVYILSLAVFWFWVGRGLDRQLAHVKKVRPDRTSFVTTMILGVAVVVSVLLGGMALREAVYGLFLHFRLFSAVVFAWSAVFLVYFGSMLLQRWRFRRARAETQST